MIERQLYLDQIRNFIGKDIIKVITGLRRSGKSVFLKQIMATIESDYKIYIDFDLMPNFKYTDAEKLHQHIVDQLNPTGKTYIFLDEIQEVEDFEKVLNSLKTGYDVDIYVTGSNSRLLSGELATYLAGRYVTIQMYPFSYGEFLQCRPEGSFNDYLIEGGLPFVTDLNPNEQDRRKMIDDIFNSVVLKDIVARHKIRDVNLLRNLVLYVLSQVGHIFSANSISKYLKSQKQPVSPTTILNYLEACESAFLFNRVKFEDSKGKRMLAVNDKYYTVDHGFREALVGGNIENIELVLENIVYYELLRRGFEVNVGRNGDKEIDFVAKKAGNIEYYQVTYVMGAKETRDREFGAYDGLKDNYPKYVLSTDTLDFSQNGIVHLNLEKWLLEAGNDKESFQLTDKTMQSKMSEENDER